MLKELRCRRNLGRHQLEVPRKSRGMDISFCVCALSPELVATGSVKFKVKSYAQREGDLKVQIQVWFSAFLLVSSLSAALEESTVRNYPIPAGGDSQPTETMGSGDHCRGKRGAQLQELSQSEKRRCRRAPFAAQIRR